MAKQQYLFFCNTWSSLFSFVFVCQPYVLLRNSSFSLKHVFSSLYSGETVFVPITFYFCFAPLQAYVAPTGLLYTGQVNKV